MPTLMFAQFKMKFANTKRSPPSTKRTESKYLAVHQFSMTMADACLLGHHCTHHDTPTTIHFASAHIPGT
jgi:hypothetical protein